MSDRVYSYGHLKTFLAEAFSRFGFSREESDEISGVLLLADLYGIESHGMNRLVRYHKGIHSGMIRPDAKPEIVCETPVSAVIDGHEGMGQVISCRAMELAVEKARRSGIGMVTVRNSNHYGIAGYYSKMACDEGLIGISMTNSESIVLPTFGRMAMLGTNPIAVSVPADPFPFHFDASTAVVTRGKVEVYNKKGRPLPLGWAADSSGNASGDAASILKSIAERTGGGLLPLGGDGEDFSGHKGYGFGMIVEIFCSVISQGLTSNHTHINNVGRCCHFFGAVDPGIFGDPQAIRHHFSVFLDELRQSPKADGHPRIYTHGEKEIEFYEAGMKNGISVTEASVREARELCVSLGMDPDKYMPL